MQKGVLFDVDGVLVNSYQAHFESWYALFSEFDYNYTEDEFKRGFGRTSFAILADWTETQDRDFSKEEIEAIDERKEALYREIVCANFVAIDGATDLIDELYSAGFLLGIGSSGPPENIEVVIERLDRKDLFGAIVSRLDVTRGKPDPQVFALGAKRLGIPPSNCAVIEDAAAGIVAANAAGMTSIALTGTTNRENLSDASLVVDSLQELSAEVISKLIC